MNPKKPDYIIALLSLLLGAPPLVSSAQTKAAATEPPREETVLLNAFEVTGDPEDSYEALNTSGVTGTNRSIRSLPVTMNVYTRTFLDEINATDITQVLTFTPNVTLSNDASNGGAQASETLRIRGIKFKEERHRNGFVSLANSDNFSTERIEILRGAQALLYGQGTSGGVINTVTKRAVEGRFTEVTAFVNDEGTRRLTIDHNNSYGPYSLRVVGLVGVQGFWQDNLIDKPAGLYVDAVRRIGKNFTLRASHEYYEQNARLRDGISSNIVDNSGTDKRVGKKTDVLLYTGGDVSGIIIGGQPLTYENFHSAQSSVTRRRAINNTTVVALEGNLTPNLSTRVAWEYQDVNTFFQSGTADLVAPTDSNAINRQWSIRLDPGRNRNTYHIWVVQAAAVYQFSLGKILKNQLVVGAEERLKQQYFLQQRLYQVDGSGNFVLGTNNIGRNQIAPFYAAVQNSYPNNITPPPGYAWGDSTLLDYLPPTPANPRGVVGTGTLRVEKELAGYVNWLGNWFNDRADTMIGVRFDKVTIDNAHLNQNITDTTKGSGTVGFVYNFTPSLGLYANVSKSFAAAGIFQPTLDNTFPEPGTGITKEVGLKFDVWGRRISGSLAFFENKSESESVQFTQAIVRAIDPLGINGNSGHNSAIANVHARGVELVLTAQPAKGWRVYFSVGTNDATISSGYSHAVFYNDQFNTDGTTVKVKQANGSLIDLTVPVTPSQPAGPRTPLSLAMMRDPLSPYFARLDPINGQILNASSLFLTTAGVATGAVDLPITQHQLGFVPPNNGIVTLFQPGDFTTPNSGFTMTGNTNYDFPSGLLKNFSVGGSLNWQRKIRQGYATIGGTRQVYYQPDLAVADLRFNYRLREGRNRWNFQFTIQNVFDTQPVNWTLDAAGALNTVNVLQVPRNYILSAKLRF